MTKESGCLVHLRNIGISAGDAIALRRIAMTLHRWRELECGDSNDYASWCIVRGHKVNGVFEYDDNGTAFEERHTYSESKAWYTPIPDREKGALTRLDKIMKGYPGFASYVQGDPRGSSLYILSPDVLAQIPGGADGDVGSHYSRGVAVYK